MNCAEPEAQSSSVIRILAGDNNKFKIVLSNLSGTPAKTSPEKTVFASPAELSTPNSGFKKLKDVAGKRGAVEAGDFNNVQTNGKQYLKAAKRGKYERKSCRLPGYENNLASWSTLRYQPNIQVLQAQISQQSEDSSPALVQALANSYAYNENISFLRARARKECTAQNYKRALVRPAFNQNQAFYAVSYKPDSYFVHFLNHIGKNQGADNIKPKPTDDLEKKGTSETTPSTDYAENNKTSSTESGSKFICEWCQRTDAKKYAKNLCQTCYKKQKKLLEEYSGSVSGIRETEVIPKPQLDVNCIGSREWNGKCPYCLRYLRYIKARTDVKHYAKGMCTGCYRKARKKVNFGKIPESEEGSRISVADGCIKRELASLTN